MITRFLRNRFGQSRSQGRGESEGGSGQGGRRGRRRSGGNKPGSGPGGNCVCPACGRKIPHAAGQRCIDQVCPGCGAKMIRETQA
jgi:hypothetical protein